MGLCEIRRRKGISKREVSLLEDWRRRGLSCLIGNANEALPQWPWIERTRIIHRCNVEQHHVYWSSYRIEQRLTRRTENDSYLLEGGKSGKIQVYPGLQSLQADGSGHLLIRGSEACSIFKEEGRAEFNTGSMDPLQAQLVYIEDWERGHSEEVARVLNPSGGRAFFGGADLTYKSSRREEEEGWGEIAAHSRNEEEY